MQLANIMLGVDGRDTTVPKYEVTPSEIAVLRSIHGEDRVFDIEPAGETARTGRQELQRLRIVYGSAKDGEGNRIVDMLFPGLAARAFETLAELQLDEELFKPLARAKAEPAPATAAPSPVANADDLDDMTKAELVAYAKTRGIEVDAGAKKADVLQAILDAQAPAGDDADDEIGEMPDQNLFQ